MYESGATYATDEGLARSGLSKTEHEEGLLENIVQYADISVVLACRGSEILHALEARVIHVANDRRAVLAIEIIAVPHKTDGSGDAHGKST